MKTHGKTISDQQVVEKVMISLTSKFYFVVVTILEFINVKTMKIEELLSSLEAHEFMVIDRWIERPVQQALQTKVVKKDENKRKFTNKGKGSFKSVSWSNNDKSKFDAKDESFKRREDFDINQSKKMHCYNCEKYKHFSNDGWHKKIDKKNQNSDKEVHIV